MRLSVSRAARGASRAVLAVCCCAAFASACGGAGPNDSASDASSGASSGANGGADGGVPAPSALAGRWWGWLPFGSPLASPSLPVLVAFEVDPAPAGPVTMWPAKLWIGGRATEFGLAPASPDGSFTIVGTSPFNIACGAVHEAPTFVPQGSTLNLEIDGTGCGGSPTQVAGTLTRSNAQRVELGVQSLAPAATPPDSSYFAFGVGDHPWLWDVANRSLVDMAPAAADGGAIGTGATYVALAPGDGHAAYCTQGGDTGSALVDFDVARGVAEPIDTGVGCDAPELAFSADGSHLAYTVLSPGSSAVDVRVRDFARGTSVTAYHGVATEAPYWFWAGKSGRYLVYYATTSTSLGTSGEFYTPLDAYDAQTGQSRSLGDARYLTASPDGRFLAFSRSDGMLVVWDEQAGAATAIDTLADTGATGSYVTSTNNIEYIPLGLSPDGKQLLYVDATFTLRLLALGSTAPRAAGASRGCGSGPTPTGTGTGVFSDDSASLGFMSATACSGSIPAYAAHVFGLASSHDASVTLPAQADEVTPEAVSPGGTLAYAYETSPGNMQVHVWSQAAGDVNAQPNGDTLDQAMFGISDDGNRVFFRETGLGGAVTDFLWDRTMGLTSLGPDQPLANPDYPLDFFLPIFDRPSGIALTLDANARSFMVSRPGASPAVSVKPDEGIPPVWSTTRKTVAVTGVLGANHGVFTYAFASGAHESFVEGGTVVATNDGAVYFMAADGLCMMTLP